ncbi:DUF4190 domain-containing protein [uncultured Aurantimicrobium sp.]|uniref:DUF4190 domain-containing protein n=1 Tax=uncultured Aurantimicrobium sp. TaxID=1705357 RepID=UPI0026168D10|nr:DUF4190 domain-containing protein [uncultured Aurantimicrobium sp.]
MTEKAAPKTPKAAKPVTVVTPEPVAVPKTNILAIVALVTGIAGLTVVPFVSSIVAVVTGHMARKEVRRTGEQGDGLALAGLITGYIGIGLGLLVAVLLIAFFGIVLASGINSYGY